MTGDAQPLEGGRGRERFLEFLRTFNSSSPDPKPPVRRNKLL